MQEEKAPRRIWKLDWCQEQKAGIAKARPSVRRAAFYEWLFRNPLCTTLLRFSFDTMLLYLVAFEESEGTLLDDFSEWVMGCRFASSVHVGMLRKNGWVKFVDIGVINDSDWVEVELMDAIPIEYIMYFQLDWSLLHIWFDYYGIPHCWNFWYYLDGEYRSSENHWYFLYEYIS